MIYYVGQVEDEEEIPDPDSGIGSVAGQAWASVTRSALMPGCVTPTTSSAPGGTTGGCGQVIYPRSPSKEIMIKLNEFTLEFSVHWLSLKRSHLNFHPLSHKLDLNHLFHVKSLQRKVLISCFHSNDHTLGFHPDLLTWWNKQCHSRTVLSCFQLSGRTLEFHL